MKNIEFDIIHYIGTVENNAIKIILIYFAMLFVMYLCHFCRRWICVLLSHTYV